MLVELTPDLTPEKAWQRPFIKRLCETGNVSAACRRAKITRQNAYVARANDALFDVAWKEALEVATEALELEARRRAEKGVLDPVYHQGMQVGQIRKYSDTLMIFLLKAHKPDTYRDNQHVQHSGSVDLNIVKGYVGITPDDWDEDKADSSL